jgi:hypothetical protein
VIVRGAPDDDDLDFDMEFFGPKEGRRYEVDFKIKLILFCITPEDLWLVQFSSMGSVTSCVSCSYDAPVGVLRLQGTDRGARRWLCVHWPVASHRVSDWLGLLLGRPTHSQFAPAPAPLPILHSMAFRVQRRNILSPYQVFNQQYSQNWC